MFFISLPTMQTIVKTHIPDSLEVPGEWGEVQYWRCLTFGGYVPLAPPNPYPVPDQHLVEF